MALTTLGPALDLHVGGADLRYPHHAYESAMAEAVTGVAPFARAWLHVGTVRAGRREDGQEHGQPGARVRRARQAPGGARCGCCWSTGRGRRSGSTTRPRSTPPPPGWSGSTRAAARGSLDTGTAAAAEVTAALLDDLDVPRALAVAEEAGGEAARVALSVLGLS